MKFRALCRKHPDWVITMKGSGRAFVAVKVDASKQTIRAEAAKTLSELDIILKREYTR